ncbi:DUF599 domain-containing protein [Microbulbifer sp. EKSA008]|uniref:DUF599 domain-containing protein n=1 Tax=unclassified Microbulbifer TaxID=2619833 RepID=UPI000D52C34A|nr:MULTISPECIES: DUF599 domain-containing protein [unclassified Microbulbifer]AWF81686.1 DUF599 domain-containing protein [Microbulbifer sp. A4B17]WHI46885.1 DUF599 domain-containing protein [Microbulbifer sp. VAAF005]
MSWLDIASVIGFFITWVGYTVFARKKAKETWCLTSSLQWYRVEWMMRMLDRDMRMADTAILSNLERVIGFFASTSILILAGLVTALTANKAAIEVLTSLPFAEPTTVEQFELKVMLLILIFIFAFFNFTWSLRQYSFANVLIGAAPPPETGDLSEEERRRFAISTAKVIDHAGHSYNYGLRSYYFSMSVLGWFIHPILFVAGYLFVVCVLYRREFLSRALNSILAAREGGLERQQRKKFDERP